MSIETYIPWSEKKEILVILAHPDDPEFFLGGTISRWISEGHAVHYAILTKGDKGSSDPTLTPAQIIAHRIEEQTAAADFLGVASLEFLDYPDGYLVPDLETRKQVVSLIRKYRPQILVTCDPLNLFENRRYINHPDHRAAWQVVIDAAFPAAGNIYFYPELVQAGLLPHTVEEIWMSLTGQPNVLVDVTGFFETRLEALKMHVSQIGDPIAFEERVRSWLEKDPQGNFKYEEKFRRINFTR